MDRRYVFMMLGFLGSGKSHVSRWLAPHVGAVHLSVDKLRLAMFGLDRPELYTPQYRTPVNNASRFAMEEVLKSGQAHVVHDANHNSRALRTSIARDAAKYGAMAIVVWVQTPLEIAKERTETRKVTEGQDLFEDNIVEKMAKRLQEPNASELVITIDGQATATQQQASFDKQFKAIQASFSTEIAHVS